jgi:hypothetical protein
MKAPSTPYNRSFVDNHKPKQPVTRKGYLPSYLREGFDESKVIVLPTVPIGEKL